MLRFITVLLALSVMYPSNVGAQTRQETRASHQGGRAERMHKGILAHWKSSFALRQFRRKRINVSKYAKRLVWEVSMITSLYGNTWLTPEKLLGLGTTESNLMSWVVTGWGDNLDCGITQVAVKWQARTSKKKHELCAKLKKSTFLSFTYTMKILNDIKKNYCYRYKTTDPKFDECLFNIYNQGHRFLHSKWKYCRLKQKRNETKKRFTKRYWECRFRNRYWLKNLCFARIYATGRTPKKYCRRITSLNWLKKYFK